MTLHAAFMSRRWSIFLQHFMLAFLGLLADWLIRLRSLVHFLDAFIFDVIVFCTLACSH